MKIGLFAAAVAALTVGAAPAYAATTVVDGKCVSVADKFGCLFKGNINSNPNGNPNSFKRAEEAYNLYNNTHLSAGPDITLNILGSSDDAKFGDVGSFKFKAGSKAEGSWDLTGFDVDFFAVKAGNNFVLFKLDKAASIGSWSTAQLGGKDLSHLVFFGKPTVVTTPVPEPATWAMMIAGFGLVGGAMRRRTVRLAHA
ncbi:hypothetical protein ACFB49_47300 [Sphingomonas sp. DBB INV C78]|uniref:PEPxxWA-CTERM sorting domain-containing protein n=1 Tax=Sphingomonas sp. DBB INV C78 TaxID=3349434 RepID=UPI0036D23E0F